MRITLLACAVLASATSDLSAILDLPEADASAIVNYRTATSEFKNLMT